MLFYLEGTEDRTGNKGIENKWKEHDDLDDDDDDLYFALFTHGMQTELFRKLWKLERANYFVLEGSRLWTLKYKTTFSYLNTLASLSRGTHGVSSGT